MTNSPAESESATRRGPERPYRIDGALSEFVESEVACLVGTGDSSGRPHVIYGWAPRVRPDGVTIDVFIDTARAERTLADLAENPRIAMTIAHPVSYRSVQFKGVFQDSGPVDDVDMAWVAARREAFRAAATLVGDPPATIENLWLDEVLRVSFTVESAFDQTPGPAAGQPL